MKFFKYIKYSLKTLCKTIFGILEIVEIEFWILFEILNFKGDIFARCIFLKYVKFMIRGRMTFD